MYKMEDESVVALAAVSPELGIFWLQDQALNYYATQTLVKNKI